MKELVENDRWRDEELKKEKISAKEKEEILKTYAAKRIKILTDMNKDYISMIETQDRERESIEQSNKVSSIGRKISNLDNSINNERETGGLGKEKVIAKAKPIKAAVTNGLIPCHREKKDERGGHRDPFKEADDGESKTKAHENTAKRQQEPHPFSHIIPLFYLVTHSKSFKNHTSPSGIVKLLPSR